MTEQQYIQAYPIPEGITLFGRPLTIEQQVEICTFGLASEIFAQVQVAFAKANLSAQGLSPIYSAPAIANGNLMGDQFSGLPTPNTPPLPTDFGDWWISGALVLTQSVEVQAAVPGGMTVIPAGTVVTVSENCGNLNARLSVPKFSDGGALDKNHIVDPNGNWIDEQNGFAIQFDLTSGAPIAVLYCAGS